MPRLDTEFRAGLQIYMERLLLANTLLPSETWVDRLTLEQKADRLSVCKRGNSYAKQPLQTNDTFEFLYRQVRNKKLGLSHTINNFKSNELLVELSDDPRSIVLKTRLKLSNFEGGSAKVHSTEQISGITLLRIFKVCLEQFESNLFSLEPFMEGKEPPYGLDSDFLRESFGDLVVSRFPTLRNAWSGPLDFHDSSLDDQVPE